MDVSLPDGTILRNVPDGTTQTALIAKLKANGYDTSKLEAPTQQAAPDSFTQAGGRMVRDAMAGAVRGAGSIGATLLAPLDAGARALGIQNDYIGRTDRREAMTNALADLGADTNSLSFKAGKLGSEIAGTAGAGGAIARAAGAIPAVAQAAPGLINAIRTGGFVAGRATPGVAGFVGNALTRAAGGAVAGGASAGLVDPEQAGTGAIIGGALPVAVQAAGAVGNAVGRGVESLSDSAAKRLMQSAIKPTIKQLKSGEADTAVQTLLDYGINPTKGGVNKLQALIDAKNAEIESAIQSSGATIDKQNVLQALGDVRQRFGSQVSPTSDLASIQNVADDFLAHPNLPGNTIPVQAAQDMKQGTYSVLRGKYGQMGSAETEAQKGLARGLKEQIAAAVPEVGPLNAEESRLLTTLSVAERRSLMEMNKNPMGLAALAHNPVSWAMFMADKSALFKSLAARAVNQLSGAPAAMQPLLSSPGGQAVQQLGYRAAPVALSER